MHCVSRRGSRGTSRPPASNISPASAFCRPTRYSHMVTDSLFKVLPADAPGGAIDTGTVTITFDGKALRVRRGACAVLHDGRVLRMSRRNRRRGEPAELPRAGRRRHGDPLATRHARIERFHWSGG